MTASCVSWVVLTSYAVLLGIGVLGVWVSVSNFGDEEPLPPTPPPELETTTTTTTTTTNSYGYGYYRRNDGDKTPEQYMDYIYASHRFARPTNDARLYVLLPSVVSVVVAALALVGGLGSKQFFSSTYSLYSSLSLWLLTLTWIIIYQDVVAWNSGINLDYALWIVVIQVVLMLHLSAQILLCVVELRRQESGWPTINWRSIFTAEALLVTARLTLTVYSLISLSDSQMFRGYAGPEDDRYSETPRIRYPLVLTFVCCSAACYNAVATLETMLSLLLGKLHICMTTVTSLLSALCCVTVAVLNSPVIVKSLITPAYIYLDTMYLAIGLSLATFLHVVACLGFPSTSRSPPEILKKIIDGLVSAVYSLGNNAMSEQIWRPALPQMRGKSQVLINFISSIFSLLSIVVIAASWDSPLYRVWGLVVVLCANSAVLVRTLPPLVMELRFKQVEDIPVNQKLMAMALENTALLVGAIAACARSYYGGEIFAGVANLFFFVFQILIMVQLWKTKCGGTMSEEVERLSQTEEVTSQGEDDEQNPSDLLA